MNSKVYASVLALTAFCVSGCQSSQPRWTRKTVEIVVKKGVAPKSGKVWLKRKGWTYKFIAIDHFRNTKNVIVASIPRTTNNFPVTGDTYVNFNFDAADKLQSYKVDEILTGP